MNKMVGLSIAGPRGGKVKEEEVLFNFTNECIDILGLDLYKFELDIFVSNKFERDFADAVGCCYGDTESVVVELARRDWNDEKSDMLTTLAHEMIHVWQCVKGERFKENPARKHEAFLTELVMARLDLELWSINK
jgi:hypothetical protein